VLPADIRLMNAVAAAVFVLATLALLAAAVGWMVRAPLFTVRSIELDGEMSRSNLATVRANALPQLAGNFFTFDLGRGRAAFESVPCGAPGGGAASVAEPLGGDAGGAPCRGAVARRGGQ